MAKKCSICGRVLPEGFFSDDFQAGVPKKKAKCPKCGSMKNWRDGVIIDLAGDRQRYLCRDCGYRFSK